MYQIHHMFTLFSVSLSGDYVLFLRKRNTIACQEKMWMKKYFEANRDWGEVKPRRGAFAPLLQSLLRSYCNPY